MKKLITILSLIVLCFLTHPVNKSETVPHQTTEYFSETCDSGVRLIDRAKKYLGYPYKWGSVGPKSFDCSGFVYWLFKQDGIHLNRTSRQQYFNGRHVKRTELQPGDLVFFARGKSPSSIYHVGIIVDSDPKGNYTFIHSTRGGVKISKSDRYNNKHFGATRIFAS